MARTPKTTAKFNRNVERAIEVAQGKRYTKTARRKDGPGGRFYEIDDRQYPSVTHVLNCIGKPALQRWAYNQAILHATETAANLYIDTCKLPPMSRPAYISTFNNRLGKHKADLKQLEKAGEIGTQAHKLIEWTLRKELGQVVGPEPHVVAAAQWAYMAFQDWATKCQLKPLYIEQTVYSTKYEFAGTMDLLAEVDGVVSLVDFKTGKAIYSESFLQNVAYQEAFIEMGHQPTPEQGIILRLPKNEQDPEFEVAVVPDRQSLMPVFLAVRQVWEWWFAAEQAYRESRSPTKKASSES
jgi:hypothetical protein